MGVSTGAKPDEFGVAVRVPRLTPGIYDLVRHVSAKAGLTAIDLRATGNILALYLNVPGDWRRRPLVPGCSVGHYCGTAGTLGIFLGNGQILSNRHVFAPSGAELGDPILQPGPVDGGHAPEDEVGVLRQVVPLDRSGDNVVDAATCELGDHVDLGEPRLDGLAALGGAVRPAALNPDDVVRKRGRTTGQTEGRVTAIEIDSLAVRYDGDTVVRFSGQIEIEGVGDTPFSAPGDSGSVVMLDGRPAALVFAGANFDGWNVTYANPLDAVLDRLQT
jgi:hypothetical protein